METIKSFSPEIYTQNDESFLRIALDIFRYQANYNPLYKEFLTILKTDVDQVNSLNEIPYLPISFFKTHAIKTGTWATESIFESSGTSLTGRSKHHVRDVDFYLRHSQRCFEHFYGPVTDYHFLALLPSYLERSGSSLISMIQYFIEKSQSQESGFYLNEYDRLFGQIERIRKDGRKIILWGVSFALLDLAEKFSIDLSDCYLFETGGMKGRRKEITRQELHDILRSRFNSPKVFSEYGMTELLSQAYATGGFRFFVPPTMRIVGRELSDPLSKGVMGETSGLNIVDLANWNTMSFVETEDLGKVFPDGTFEVQGRIDNSEVRGCNLLI